MKSAVGSTVTMTLVLIMLLKVVNGVHKEDGVMKLDVGISTRRTYATPLKDVTGKVGINAGIVVVGISQLNRIVQIMESSIVSGIILIITVKIVVAGII
jgi:hypothetical protein